MSYIYIVIVTAKIQMTSGTQAVYPHFDLLENEMLLLMGRRDDRNETASVFNVDPSRNKGK